METLKKIVSNQYFPAAAVLTAVVLFWTIAMFGGLSLLHNNQPPMATLTWLLFVYAAAVLTPLAGIIAATDLVRRWRRNRQYLQVELAQTDVAQDEMVDWEIGQYELQDEPAQDVDVHYESVQIEPAQDVYVHDDSVQDESVQAEPDIDGQQPAPESSRQSAPTQPVQYRPATQYQPAKKQPAKKQPAQTKQRKTAA